MSHHHADPGLFCSECGDQLDYQERQDDLGMCRECAENFIVIETEPREIDPRDTPLTIEEAEDVYNNARR